MKKKILLLSLIVPCDAPRIQVRYIEALKYQFTFEQVYLRTNKNYKDGSGIFKFLLEMRGAFTKNYAAVIAFDPIALFLVSFLRRIFFSDTKLIYDRNENWPLNWLGRKNRILTLIGSKFPSKFVFFEQLFLKHFDAIVAVNFTVRSAINFNGARFIYPNRSYFGIQKSSLSLSTKEKEYDFVYAGSINEFRAIDDIITFAEALDSYFGGNQKPILLIGKTSSYSQKILKAQKTSELIKLLPWQCQYDLLKNLLKAKYGIVGLNDVGQFNDSIPGKFSDYFSLDMPVVCLGNARSLQKVMIKNRERVFTLSSFGNDEVGNIMEKLQTAQLKTSHSKSFQNKSKLLSQFIGNIITNDVH